MHHSVLCPHVNLSLQMDRVECMTVFESYSFNVGKVRLHWKRQGIPVEIIGNIQLPDFVMTHYIHEKATFHYPAGVWDQVSEPSRNKWSATGLPLGVKLLS